MKKSTQIILSLGLALGLISTSFAANSFADKSSQNVQQYRSMVSADTVLNYSKVLLDRSTVAQKLKFSGDFSDRARYNEATGILEEANKAFQAGNDTEAKKLAIESIRVIARSVPRYYSRMDQNKQTQVAKNSE